MGASVAYGVGKRLAQDRRKAVGDVCGCMLGHNIKLNLRTAVRNLFAPLAEAKKLEVDVSRKKLGSVRLLDEEWAGVKNPKCDYFDLEFINKEIVLKGGHHGQ